MHGAYGAPRKEEGISQRERRIKQRKREREKGRVVNCDRAKGMREIEGKLG